MTPEQAQREWEKACPQVGYHRFCPDAHIGGKLTECNGLHGIPPIGDPAATVAMLAELLKHKHEITIANHMGEFYIIGFPDHAETLPLALAAAVNALPQEKV